MSLKSGKHIVGEINGVRCTIIESGITQERVNFLKDLLEYNKLEVKVMRENNDNPTPTFTLGVTNIVFNPVIAVYDCSLRTKEGKIVTPAYWDQLTTVSDTRYWIIRKYSFQQNV